MNVAEIRTQIDLVIRLIERLNERKAQHDRLRRVLPKTEPPEPAQRCTERVEKWWLQNAQRLVDEIKKRLDALYPEIQAYWSDKWTWDSFCMMLTDGKDDYEKWKASGWAERHIQELQRVSVALAQSDQKPTGCGQPSEMSPGGTMQVEAMDEAAKAGSKPIIGDTWDLFGGTFYWRNAISRFRSLSRWKKAIAVAGVLLLVLAYFTRSVWLPLVGN